MAQKHEWPIRQSRTMAISQHGRFATQNRILRIFESIEPAEEVPDLSSRYLISENRTDFGNCYRIIATSNKQYIVSFIPTSTIGDCSTKCAPLPERWNHYLVERTYAHANFQFWCFPSEDARPTFKWADATVDRCSTSLDQEPWTWTPSDRTFYCPDASTA